MSVVNYEGPFPTMVQQTLQIFYISILSGRHRQKHWFVQVESNGKC